MVWDCRVEAAQFNRRLRTFNDHAGVGRAVADKVSALNVEKLPIDLAAAV
jgi:hypothetical protein